MFSELDIMLDENHIDNELCFAIKEKFTELRNEILIKTGDSVQRIA